MCLMKVESISGMTKFCAGVDHVNLEYLLGPILNKMNMETSQLISERLEKNGNTISLIVSRRFYSTIFAISSAFQNSTFLELETTEELSTLTELIAQYIQRFPQCLGVCLEKYPTKEDFFHEIQASHPERMVYGCTLHGLYLLIQDLFSGSSPDHPLNFLNSILHDCLYLTKYLMDSFRYHFPESLDLKFRDEGLRLLVAGDESRWSYAYPFLKAILESAASFVDLVNQSEKWFYVTTIPRQKIFDLVTSESFVLRLQKALQILSPIDLQIRRFQTKKAYLSDVCDSWKVLEGELSNLLPAGSPDATYLGEKFQSQTALLISPLHEISHFLDPRYYGQDSNPNNESTYALFLSNSAHVAFPATIPDRVAAISEELIGFRNVCASLKESGNLRLKLVVDGEISLSEYWNSISLRFPLLHQIAVKLFTLSPSGYATEQYWNHEANIEIRYQELSKEHRKKFLNVKSNLYLLRAGNDDYDEKEEDEKLAEMNDERFSPAEVEYREENIFGLFFWSYPEDPESDNWSWYKQEDSEKIEEWMDEGFTAELY
jgi:hypothetical protein